MRIRIVQRPPTTSMDGVRLERFEPDHSYDVDTALGAVLLAEGWAVQVLEPTLPDPLTETVTLVTGDPPNLVRQQYPPSVEALSSVRQIWNGAGSSSLLQTRPDRRQQARETPGRRDDLTRPDGVWTEIDRQRRLAAIREELQESRAKTIQGTKS